MLLKVLVGLALAGILAAAGMTHFRYDCGEPSTEVKQGRLKKSGVLRTKRVTAVPERNWKGECIVTYTTETSTYGPSPERTVKVLVFRTKPEPVTLLP